MYVYCSCVAWSLAPFLVETQLIQPEKIFLWVESDFLLWFCTERQQALFFHAAWMHMGKLTAKSVAMDLLQSNFGRSTSIWSLQTFCSKSLAPKPSVSKALQSATLISCLAYKVQVSLRKVLKSLRKFPLQKSVLLFFDTLLKEYTGWNKCPSWTWF